MSHAFICDAQRTPFGRYGGALSGIRADDLGAIPIRALIARTDGASSMPASAFTSGIGGMAVALHRFSSRSAA